MPGDLRAHWESFRKRFVTRTRDTSEHAYDYIYGMLTMDKERSFAGISQRVRGEDGQSLQHFMSESPWQGQAVFQTIQDEVCQTAALAKGSYLVLDESADEKAGAESAGVSRQYNGHLGKVDMCQVAVLLGYVNWQSGPWTSWAWLDGELFLPEEWFSPEFAQRRKKMGIPESLEFKTKLDLGLDMIRRVKKRGVPFEGVACDELYGRDAQFRADLDQEQAIYAAFVPINHHVYLHQPRIGIPEKALGKKGKAYTRERVLNGELSIPVSAMASDPKTEWHLIHVRQNERGVLEDRFTAQKVWTWQAGQTSPRPEWLIIRVDQSNEYTYALSNAPDSASLEQLACLICSRYFVERSIQDAKDECGWDEFQAQKYSAWSHHIALTACALWFIAKEKLKWGTECERDPELIHQLDVQVLPALSTANVRALLKAVLPLPELSVEEARRQIVHHLVNRSRSKASRLRHRAKAPAPT